MRVPIRKRVMVLVLAFVGAAAGFAYGWYSVELAIAHMRAHWGWVCGTGLEIPLYFWTSVGTLAGACTGAVLLRTRFKPKP